MVIVFQYVCKRAGSQGITSVTASFDPAPMTETGESSKTFFLVAYYNDVRTPFPSEGSH